MINILITGSLSGDPVFVATTLRLLFTYISWACRFGTRKRSGEILICFGLSIADYSYRTRGV